MQIGVLSITLKSEGLSLQVKHAQIVDVLQEMPLSKRVFDLSRLWYFYRSRFKRISKY